MPHVKNPDPGHRDRQDVFWVDGPPSDFTGRLIRVSACSLGWVGRWGGRLGADWRVLFNCLIWWTGRWTDRLQCGTTTKRTRPKGTSYIREQAVCAASLENWREGGRATE